MLRCSALIIFLLFTALSSAANLIVTLPPLPVTLPALTRILLHPIPDYSQENTYDHDVRRDQHAYLTTSNNFIFPARTLGLQQLLKAGGTTTWSLEIGCRDYDFPRYEVDFIYPSTLEHNDSDPTQALRPGETEVQVNIFKIAPQGWRVKSDAAQLTLRLADGEAEGRYPQKSKNKNANTKGGGYLVSAPLIGSGDPRTDASFQLRVLKVKDYYETRPGFSPLSLLKNPMILIGVVGLAFVMGVPYLIDNMDPEMRAEFEEQQRSSVLSGSAGNIAAGQNPLQNFDLAGWMAGRGGDSSSGSSTPVPAGGAGNKATGREKGASSGQARRRG